MNFDNGLTKAEAERLAILAEEQGRTGQAVSASPVMKDFLQCPKHIRYAARRKPNSSCEYCWTMWLEKNRPVFPKPKIAVRCEKSCSIATRPCGKLITTRDVDVIQNWYYIRPYSCTGGDYWTFEEEDKEFRCPHCYHINRVRYHSQKEILKLDNVWRSVIRVDSHSR